MTRGATALPILYRLVTALLAPLAPLWLRRRVARGKEDRTRLQERFGVPRGTRPAGPVVWCHAASVGKSLTLLPLIAALLQRPGWCVVVTTGTVTSAALMAARLPAGAEHRYVPLDHAPWVRRFLDHWRPALAIWAESELWPVMLDEIATRRIPAVLVNARMSDRAFKGWRRWPGFARHVLSAFTAVLAQSPEDGRRYRDLGAPDVHVTGNLKLAVPPLPADEAAASQLAAAIAGRPAWLAASIHPGEDALAAQVHQSLRYRHGELLTIAVPRHPERADAMTAVFANAGLRVVRRSRGETITAETDIYLADTVGELGVFYRACPIVFMGKSFAVGGGQNPAEPAQLGCAVVFGPDMSNFRDMTDAMLRAGAALQLHGVKALAEAISRLLAEPAERERMAANAGAFMDSQGQALAATLAVLDPLMPPYQGRT